jgi:hypothetical protein
MGAHGAETPELSPQNPELRAPPEHGTKRGGPQSDERQRDSAEERSDQDAPERSERSRPTRRVGAHGVKLSPHEECRPPRDAESATAI